MINRDEVLKNIKFRMADVSDAEAILKIYEPYVTDTAITFEYDVPSIEEFQQRIRSTLQKLPYIAAVQNGKIIGYAYASPFKLREAYKYSVELSIYLSGECRRKGVGSRLYGLLEQILAAQGILNLNACITYGKKEENPYTSQDSVLFHEKMGFQLVGTFHKSGYKFHTWYDMIWMEKMLGEHKGSQKEVRFGEWKVSDCES